MPGIPMTLGDAADLTNVAIQRIWIKVSDLERETFYNRYFNVETGITDRLMRDSSISGLSNAARVTENTVITGEAPIQGNDQTYTQVEYGKLMSFTKQMWKFGIQKRDLENVVEQLRSACERRREILCAERLDNSFSSSYTTNDDSGNYSVTTTGGDSRPLIDNAHTREDGGTNWNNRVTDGTTVNMDFDYDAIQAVHRTFSLVRDAVGNLSNFSASTFIFRKGFPNAFRAQEILGAIRSGGKGSMPASADNDAAGVPAFEVIELPWIETNTAFWWAYDASFKGLQYGLQYKESQPIMLEGPHVVFTTGEIQYKATMLFDIGHNDSRNWAGSQNTNSS